MTNKILLAAAVAVLMSACGGSGSAQEKGPISEARTAAFKAMMPEYVGMGKVLNGDEAFDAEQFKKSAATFAQNARKPFEHFQNDTAGNGHALPEIWSKPAEYQARHEKFIAAVDELNAKAQTGKMDEIKAAYGQVSASCKSCHSSFRSN
ncbi:MAG: cytochrome b562 [Neisseria sp.]|uniref:c-type cytochrome n=1 Tax=Neisseria sp. TaxID=192066 RepID=UPI0026DA8249|nr:cytochrome b562 [Neisseria sp.]MDO4640422.1 cytochrome b562 [Neisseria sp.]